MFFFQNRIIKLAKDEACIMSRQLNVYYLTIIPQMSSKLSSIVASGQVAVLSCHKPGYITTQDYLTSMEDKQKSNCSSQQNNLTLFLQSDCNIKSLNIIFLVFMTVEGIPSTRLGMISELSVCMFHSQPQCHSISKYMID